MGSDAGPLLSGNNERTPFVRCPWGVGPRLGVKGRTAPTILPWRLQLQAMESAVRVSSSARGPTEDGFTSFSYGACY